MTLMLLEDPYEPWELWLQSIVEITGIFGTMIYPFHIGISLEMLLYIAMYLLKLLRLRKSKFLTCYHVLMFSSQSLSYHSVGEQVLCKMLCFFSHLLSKTLPLHFLNVQNFFRLLVLNKLKNTKSFRFLQCNYLWACPDNWKHTNQERIENF